jgi:negative regulator of flagellin synthesis FlgM
MKIGNSPDYAPAATERNPQDAPQTATTTPAAATDRVTLSADALQLAAGQADGQRMPVFDTRRINEIRRAIADGSYTTDPARIAARLWQLGG